ncbi:MAG: hypothetical protein KBD16_00870 [Candidatus Pacebacteria bacterium]|nr:hypothetical protein [Candidatus Paceibacterota bacterium]
MPTRAQKKRTQEQRELVEGIKRRLEERLAATTAFSPADRLRLMRACFTELVTRQGWLAERNASSLEGSVARIALLKKIEGQVNSFAKDDDEKMFLMNELILSFGQEIRMLQQLPSSERAG